MSRDRPTPDPITRAPTAGADPVTEYEICVAGRLSPRWSTWFDGLDVADGPDGSTVIRGPVVDQAALHGLIQKLRDVGVPLISLTRIPSPTPTEPAARAIPDHPTHEEN